MRKFICSVSIIFAITICALFNFMLFYFIQIPNNMRFFYNETYSNYCDCLFGVNLFKTTSVMPTGKNFLKNDYDKGFLALLFNFIPIKNIKLQHLGEQIYVKPGGTPFGLKFLTDGAMVINLQKIQTDDGDKFPAKKSGIQKGDVIISANNKKISNNDQLKKIIINSNGENVTLKVKRGAELLNLVVTPVFSKKLQIWQSGILVRDSSAGLGTLTFSTQTGFFGGLGHAVFDSDTGNSLPLGSGELVEVSINEIKQANLNSPGELCGDFINSKPIGKIKMNTDCGLYGELKTPINQKDLIPVGLKQEAKIGKAFIYSTVEGSTPQRYEIEIESIDFKQDVKNFVIKVIDESLLKKTGGIVQGMSGSPIIQNNKLIGAVTHVFLNDPSHGYGVFAENMVMFLKEMTENKYFYKNM